MRTSTRTGLWWRLRRTTYQEHRSTWWSKNSERRNRLSKNIAIVALAFPALALSALPAASQEGGLKFSRTPAAGPPGTAISVASVDPCPDQRGSNTVRVYTSREYSSEDVYLPLRSDGSWAGTITVASGRSDEDYGSLRIDADCGYREDVDSGFVSGTLHGVYTSQFFDVTESSSSEGKTSASSAGGSNQTPSYPTPTTIASKLYGAGETNQDSSESALDGEPASPGDSEESISLVAPDSDAQTRPSRWWLILGGPATGLLLTGLGWRLWRRRRASFEP